MMPTAESISHVIPNHVLRVGQTIRLDSEQVTFNQHPRPSEPSCSHGDPDLDISLDNLNQLILELDPSFEPIEVNKSPTCLSPPTDDSCTNEDDSHCILVARGCSPSSFSVGSSHCIPIPTQSCSPLPPLPCGSVPRRNLSPKPDMSFPQGSLQLSHSNRNSSTSLLSTSVGSETSYILGSNLSLASEDAESPESVLAFMSGSFSDGYRTRHFDNRSSPEKTFLTRQGLLLEPNGRGAQSSPASLSGSLNDIPVVLVNGSPQSDQHIQACGPETDRIQTSPVSNSKPFSPNSFQTHFNGSQPSMKFVMDTSRFWFRPNVSRAEAEAMVTDKEAGTFVVRDSTSYRGSFGLAMKVEPSNGSPGDNQEEKSSDVIRHFLIESTSKGVRIRGSSLEPFFGSLSALVYQHSISAFALPCKLLLPSHDLGAEEKKNDKPAPEDKRKKACNFIYLNAVPTEMLTGPCAVQRAVSSTLAKASGSFTPTVVNLKASSKGVTLTDVNRRLFFRRHYPARLLSHSGEDPDNRLWLKGCSFAARMFGFVAKGVEAGAENVCHVFAEYDPLQPCNKVIEVIQAAISRP
ncbi:tensin-4-like isoform X2 [Antennarius striatus]|uniref:tensin-4-like isoform X2 n=1 Tax=Antennarius striatus TaxID=241820 RepID=UPI0035AE4231